VNVLLPHRTIVGYTDHPYDQFYRAATDYINKTLRNADRDSVRTAILEKHRRLSTSTILFSKKELSLLVGSSIIGFNFFESIWEEIACCFALAAFQNPAILRCMGASMYSGKFKAKLNEGTYIDFASTIVPGMDDFVKRKCWFYQKKALKAMGYLMLG